MGPHLRSCLRPSCWLSYCTAGTGLPELREYLLQRATPGEWTLDADQATDRGEEEQARGRAARLGAPLALTCQTCSTCPALAVRTLLDCSPPPCRMQALEVVREKLFLRLYKELPYACQLRLGSCLPLHDGSSEHWLPRHGAAAACLRVCQRLQQGGSPACGRACASPAREEHSRSPPRVHERFGRGRLEGRPAARRHTPGEPDHAGCPHA